MNSVSLAATPSFNRATIYAAGRGKPLINLSDEKTLIQTFAGEESLVSIEREIFHLIEAAEIHFLEAEGIFVCRNSLTNGTEPLPLPSGS